MKKIKSAALAAALSIIFSVMPCRAAENAAVLENIAVAELGQSLSQSGFEKVEPGTSQTPEIAVRGGSYCWLLDKLQGDGKAFINFKLSKDFKGTRDGSEYEIEYEYYDSGEGFVRLVYDSAAKSAEIGDTVYTQNKKVWKMRKIVLSDALFEGRLDGKYDFRLTIKENGTGSTASGESIGIRSVTVRRIAAKNPIFVSADTDEPGNSFAWYAESKIIRNRFENLSNEEKRVNIRYYLINGNYRIYFDKTDSAVFAPGEVRESELDIGELKRADIYKYHAEITSEDGSINSDYELCDIAVLKTDPNGILNDDVLYCAHLEWYGDTKIKEDGIKLIKMSNSYGIRSSFDWNSMEPSKGTLDWNNHNMKFIVEELYKNGLHLIPSISGPSLFYCESWNDMPYSAEQLAGWRNFIAYAAKTLKQYGVTEYEIWNEPNIANFNKYLNDRRGDAYAKLLETAAEEIKKVDPTAKVGGPSVTGINGHWGKDYFTEAMDAGMYKYADAIVLHPYEQKPPEICGMDENIKWFKNKYREKGIDDPDIWNTELGYTTADDNVADEEAKGALNCRTVLLYKSKDLGERCCIYNFEQKGTILTDREDMFGSVSPASYKLNREGKPFIPTEAFGMVTGMNYVMAQSSPDGVFDSADANVRINRYKSDKFGAKIVSLYTVNNCENVTLNLGADKVEVYDSYGNARKMYGENGRYTFLANSRPVYIVGDIKKTEIENDNRLFDFGTAEVQAAENDIVKLNIQSFCGDDCEITAELPQNTELVSNSGFNGGTAGILLKNMCKTGEKSRVTVNITRSGKLLGSADYDIESQEAVLPKLSIGLADGIDLNRWRASADIKNVSQSHAAKGYIEFQSPASFKALGKINIGIIPRGQTGRIEFNLPEIARKGQYSLEYSISLADGSKTSFTDNIDFTVAAYAKNKPKIDGEIQKGEWNANTFMYADDIGQVKKISDWRGNSDLSGKTCVMWDEDGLYMCAEVTDDIFCQENPPSSCWQGDSVQVGIMYGEEGFLAIGQGQATFHEIGIALTPEGAAAYRFLSQDSCYAEGICQTAQTAVKRDGNKTYYEFFIPWKDLLRPTDEPPKAGDKLGFSFLINDNDGNGRRGWIEYAGGIGEEKNTALFTGIELIKP